jgi:hypothetical protein
MAAERFSLFIDSRSDINPMIRPIRVKIIDLLYVTRFYAISKLLAIIHSPLFVVMLASLEVLQYIISNAQSHVNVGKRRVRRSTLRR